MPRRRSRPVWSERNTLQPDGVGPLQRRGADQKGPYLDVDPQPKRMIPVIDESDPHPNQRDSSSVTYGVLYCLRTDDVQDKDVFNFQGYRWGVVGPARWDIHHVLTGLNFGVKQFRIRKGG